jgi:ABC-2 type transport system ATP-binding protein
VRAPGVTLLLTTQYLDEADALADRIVVVNHGQVIADGTPRELKERSRSAHVEVTLAEPGPEAAAVIAPLVNGQVRALDQAGLLVDNIEICQPSLDDVFFALTDAPIPGDSNGSGAKGTSGGQGGPGASAAEPERQGVQA